MTSSPIYNSLLRIDGLTEDLPRPFERPRKDLDFWVLELPSDGLSFAAWCVQTAQTLHSQTASLRQASLAGGRSSLFVEFAVSMQVLHFEATFLQLLADLDISLECCPNVDI